MSVVLFDQMPATSRFWIYPCERPLTESEKSLFEREMTQFVEQWAAHKRDLTAAWKIEYDQFVFVTVDENKMAASGCSIDSLVHKLRELGERLQIEIVGNAGKVYYRDGRGIQCVDRATFRKLVTEGEVDEQTIVFNNVTAKLGELENWEVPMKNSWHAQAFALQTA